MHQIARRLQVVQRTISRSIFNFIKSGKHGFKNPTGHPKKPPTSAWMTPSFWLQKIHPESHPEPSRLDYQNIL